MSVLNQTFSKWECIIVDDGSTDETEKICRNWCEKDKRFIYIKQDNKGVSAARNNGIREAKGKYILPLDGDDKLGKTYIDECYRIIKERPEVSLVYGKVFRFGDINDEWILPEYSFKNLLNGNMIVCTAMYRKSDCLNIGGYDESMHLGLEDWEFLINLLKKGGTVIRLQTCAFFYRIKERSRNADLNNSSNNMFSVKEYVFSKHFSLYSTDSLYKLFLSRNAIKTELNKTQKMLNNLEKNLSISQIIKLLVKRVMFKIGLRK